MSRRPWIFRPLIVLAILAALVAYGLIAEAVDFHLIGLRAPDESVLHHRLYECLLLWFIVCFAVGWMQFFLKRRPTRTATIRPLIIVPLVAALWLAASEGLKWYHMHVQRMHHPVPREPFLLHTGVPLILIAVPLAQWAVLSGLLVMQARIWRRPVTPGVCSTCEYDLTGNESGVCPECGMEVVTDPDIPYYYHHRRFLWLPELAEFPSARARFEASQRAQRECRRSPQRWLSIPLIVAVPAFLTPYATERLGRWQWAALGFLLAATLVSLGLDREKFRRSLRRQLAERQRNDDNAPRPSATD